MPIQEEKQEVLCAAARLAELRRAILKGSAEMLTARARVEKYLQQDVSIAQKHYENLKDVRRRLLNALSGVQLALMELEEYAAANIAGRLHTGLDSFNLMSKAYKPVYEALTNFAMKLPERPDTVNAEGIGRLMNYVRMGYYPMDSENIRHMLRGIQFPDGVTTNLLDPCCGCGKALRQIAQGNNCYTYGVELDEQRAEEALTRLHRVGMGSFFHSRISAEAFHLLFLNPPYTTVTVSGGGKARQEKRFLADSIRHLMYGGLLIYIVPYYRLTPDVCRILGENFENIAVWRFTDSEFKKFRQAAVFGQRKKRTDDPDAGAELERYACCPKSIPCISEIEEGRFVLPAEPKRAAVFKGERFNEKELERQLLQSDSFKRLMNAESKLDRKDKQPLLPLSISQIDLVGGSGMINGLIECDTPHVIKGRVIKVKKVDREEKFNGQGVHMSAEVKEVISNKMVFNILTPDGFKSLN